MIIPVEILLDELSDYVNPYAKITRMVKEKKLYPLTKGLYEDNPNASSFTIANAIYGPSYISFDTALSYYGLIPEAVYTTTSATFNKKKKKNYKNHFGNFEYRDIPSDAFPYGIEIIENGYYSFRIASIEKAICDKLYEIPLIKSQKELEWVLFVGMRIDEDIFKSINREDIYFIAKKYHSTNVSMLEKYLRRKYHEQCNKSNVK